MALNPPDPKQTPVFVNVSGGKDSTAVSLYMKELGIEHRRVFADTGWEHKDTYAYLDELEKTIGPIDRVHPLLGMADLIRKKGMFPGQVNRYCTSELKVKPINQYMAKEDPEYAARAAEKKYRPPTYFNHGAKMTPIDEAVRWSRTKRGGKEPDRERYANEPNAGCLRWGLCDTSSTPITAPDFD